MVRFLLLYVVFDVVVCFSVSAQILKVDKNHLSSDSSGYVTGVVDAAFALNNRSSTVDKENVYVGFRNNLDLVYISKRSATILIGGVNYFKIGTGPVISNGYGHLREILNRNVLLSPEAFIQFQYDESRNMKARELAGGGLRISPIRGENALHFGIGAFYEFERWHSEGQDVTKFLWKMNSYLGTEVKLNHHLKINTLVYFQTGMDESIHSYRSRISGHFELKDKVSNHFTIKLMADFLFDDRPIIPVNTFIYETHVGVQYNFN